MFKVNPWSNVGWIIKMWKMGFPMVPNIMFESSMKFESSMNHGINVHHNESIWIHDPHEPGIVRVDVSLDEGHTWVTADLLDGKDAAVLLLCFRRGHFLVTAGHSFESTSIYQHLTEKKSEKKRWKNAAGEEYEQHYTAYNTYPTYPFGVSKIVPRPWLNQVFSCHGHLEILHFAGIDS